MKTKIFLPKYLKRFFKRDGTFTYSHMLTKVVYRGAFPTVAGHNTPNRVWRHTGVKSLEDHVCEGKPCEGKRACKTAHTREIMMPAEAHMKSQNHSVLETRRWCF